MKKRIVCLFLALCTLAVLSIMVSADTSGTCGDSGDNVTWAFEADTGTVTVSGSGKMADHSDDVADRPWHALRNDIKKVVISDGVTYIGENAFCGCTALEAVSLGKDVTHIGISAFSECESLMSVSGLEHVTNIEEFAFNECKSLTSLTFADDIEAIGKSAFAGCEGLQSVTFSGSVGTIGRCAFENCASLAALTFSGDIVGIGEYAFQNCSNIKTLTFPGSVNTIEMYAFYNCTALETVTFSGYVGTVGKYAFDRCEGLKTVTFAGDLEKLTEYAFYETNNMGSIYFFGDVSSVDKHAFDKCGTSCKLYCYTENVDLRTTSQLTGKTFDPLNGELGGFTWRLGADGALTLDGSGDTSGCTADTVPWKSLTDEGIIKNIVIHSGVSYDTALFTGTYHTVTFKTDSATVYATVLVADGETATAPSAPEKNGYKLLGWYVGDTEYDFTSAVSSDLDITARWEAPDYVADLSDAVSGLQNALDKTASDLADVKAALEAKNAELEAKAAELEAKDAKQQTFTAVVCVIACLSLAGNVAIVTVAFILKRKHAH